MKKRTRTNLQILASLVCCFALLSGCGQKGPLFIPEPEPKTVPPAPEDDEQNELNES